MPTRPLACTRIRSLGVAPVASVVFTISGAGFLVPIQLLPPVATFVLPPSVQGVVPGAAAAARDDTTPEAPTTAAFPGTASRNLRGKRRW